MATLTDQEERQLNTELRRAAQARAIIEDELVKEAFDTLENRILDQFKTCPLRDIESLQGLRYMHNALIGVKSFFEEIVETGTLAQARIDEVVRQNELQSGD